MCYYVHLIPSCNPFRTTAGHVLVAINFETGVLNDTKVTLNTLQVQRHTMYVLLVSPSLKFQSFFWYDQSFWSYNPVCDKGIDRPKNETPCMLYQ